MTVKIVNMDNFKEEIESSDIPVIIDFYADWCGPCQSLKPEFEALSGEYEGKLKFVKVSVEDSPELANQFGVSGIPCLILAKEGKEFDRLVGFRPKSQLKSDIDSRMSV